MGLKIIHLPLYNQKKRESVLFFTDGEVLTQESDGAPIVPVRVNARTIVLNESNSSVMLGYTQDAIFHECVHYEEHFLFFRLQEMYCDDTSKLAKWRPRPNVPKEERKWGPVKSMEWQARFGGQFLRMPRTMVQGDAKKFLAETSKDSHNGIRMEKVICRLEDAYRVPRYRAKSRIIQLGFEAAKGAFNYVNDKRLRPFAFALGSSRGGRTFVISMKDAAKLYVVDDAFRDLLNAGHYVYVDGHFCIDDPQFVIHGERSVIMTQWAIEHVDECCLRFEKRYSCTDNDEYCYGMLFSDEAFNEQKLSFFSDENRMTLRGYVHAVQEFCNSLPNEFSKSLVAAMKTRKMTVEQLAEASGIPVRTIERLRSYPYKRYELRRVVILCLALNLPTDVSLCMMKKAGVAFSESDEDKVYELLIRQMYAMPMKTIFGVLEQCGYGEFEAK